MVIGWSNQLPWHSQLKLEWVGLWQFKIKRCNYLLCMSVVFILMQVNIRKIRKIPQSFLSLIHQKCPHSSGSCLVLVQKHWKVLEVNKYLAINIKVHITTFRITFSVRSLYHCTFFVCFFSNKITRHYRTSYRLHEGPREFKGCPDHLLR